MRIGLDFGTTHTSAAFYDGRGLRHVPLDRGNENPNLLRSMIYVDREQRRYLGVEAVKNFLENDTGRPVVYEKKVVGTIENTVAQQDRHPLEPDGPITMVFDVVIEDDVGIQGRLIQSIKTGLRSKSYEGTNIFGRYYTIQELISTILSHVRSEAEAYFQADVQEAVVGRPVIFSTDTEEDRLAEEKLREAAHMAGFCEVSFVPEPVAAASFYFSQADKPETILVFDFGGGTLDLTIIRQRSPGSRETLTTHGVALGGDDMDSAIMQYHVAKHFGTESHVDVFYDGQRIPFPDDLARLLYQWQTIPALSRPKNLSMIQRAQKVGGERGAFTALECLAARNYGFSLFERIEQAKRVLSIQPKAMIEMRTEEIDLAVDITRREFNLSIGDKVEEARKGVREAVSTAAISPAEIDVVIATGGSSVIPIFQNMLSHELAAAKMVQSNIFGSVVGGLAISAHGQAQMGFRQA